MRFPFKKFKTYNLLKAPSLRGNLRSRLYLLPIFGLVFGVALVSLVVFLGNRHQTLASANHIVYIFDNGKQETVDSKALTVGDLTAKLPLNLIPQDVVEPSSSTQIIEDNFRINIYRARPVTIDVAGQKTVVLTGQRSARVIAQQAGLNLYPEDSVTFAPGQISRGELGEEVVVTRSKPVYLNLYGTVLTVRTLATTVSGLLAEKGIVLSAGDSVKPALTTKLTAKTQVFVLRKGTKIVTVAQTVAPPVQVVNDPSLTFGISVQRQPGQPGKRLITYEIDKNGKKIQIQSAVVQDPVPQIIARGTNNDIPTNKTTIMADAGLSPSDYPYANFIVSHESGWCATKAQGEIGYCPGYSPGNVPSYGGYGLCQASDPPSKMSSAGADWSWNPITQMRWCSGYAAERYGGWANAYNHWLANGNW